MTAVKKINQLGKHLSNSTKWAEWQDGVFLSGRIPLQMDTAKWVPLMLATETLNGPTNLTLRHRLILAVVHDNAAEMATAEAQFAALRRNGYWVEGYSYWEYVKMGIMWARKSRKWRMLWGTTVEAVDASYRSIVGAYGSMPIPETREVALPHDFDTLADTVSNSAYVVKRWFSPDRARLRAYLLICVDPNLEPRRNMHVWPACGYVAVWTASEGWVKRCTPYTGWEDRKKTLLKEPKELGLPPSALLPTWRVLPTPKIMVSRTGTSAKIEWDGGIFRRATRLVTWSAEGITIADSHALRQTKKQFIPFPK